MSIAIDVDRVISVLLADGWHAVALQGDQARSSFDIDAYEFIEPRGSGDPLVLHGGGRNGVCASGATWIDKHSGNRVACPLTAVLAVMEEKPGGKK